MPKLYEAKPCSSMLLIIGLNAVQAPIDFSAPAPWTGSSMHSPEYDRFRRQPLGRIDIREFPKLSKADS
jgi:hypothetical protein